MVKTNKNKIPIKHLLPLLNSMDKGDIKFATSVIRNNKIPLEKVLKKLKIMEHQDWSSDDIPDEIKEKKWCKVYGSDEVYRCLEWGQKGREIIYLHGESRILK